MALSTRDSAVSKASFPGQCVCVEMRKEGVKLKIGKQKLQNPEKEWRGCPKAQK